MEPALAQRLRPGIEPVIDDVIAAVGREVPQYASAADAGVRAALGQGVRVALERLLDLLGADDEALGPAAALYTGIGAAEYRAGRPLQAVLSAYRVGALATWRGLSAQAVEAGIGAAQTARLAEACFAYIDEISAVSAASYARAQSADAGRRESLRRQLLEALLEGGTAAVPALAGELGWRVPPLVRIAVWDGEAMPEGVLGAASQGRTIAVVTPGELRRVGSFAPSVGTGGGVAHVPDSLKQAELLHGLRGRGGIPGAGAGAPVLADDHLAELLLAAQPDLAAALVAQELAPLQHYDPLRRAVAVDTLTAWLALGGSRAAVAGELHIHPQTVAYRMEPLKQAFAGQLSTGDGRWRLLLAGRAEQQLRAPG